jgi:hypothetical protein
MHIFLQAQCTFGCILLQSAIWNNLHPNQVIGQAAVIKEIDCLTATVDEIREVRAQVTMPIKLDMTRLAALAGWFDVHFRVCQTELALNLSHDSVRYAHYFLFNSF